MIRVCLVKQHTTYDLFTRTGPDLRAIVASSNWRSGPIGLWEAFSTTACIVWEDDAAECRIGKSTWSRFVEGWDVWPAGARAERADEVDWDAYDIVVAIDVAVPTRIVVRHPRVMWCYYMIEGGPASIDGSRRGSPFYGYNVFCSQRLAKERLTVASPAIHRLTATRRTVLDLPYYLQSSRSIRGLYPDLAGTRREGMCLSHHSREVCGSSTRAALEAFGPVRCEWSTLSDIHRAELASRYYVVLPGSVPRAGLGLIEAISAGCLALAPSQRLWGFPELVLPELDFASFDELLALLGDLEAEPAWAARCLTAQQELIDRWCFANPVTGLEAALTAFRESRATPARQRRAERRSHLWASGRRQAVETGRQVRARLTRTSG